MARTRRGNSYRTTIVNYGRRAYSGGRRYARRAWGGVRRGAGYAYRGARRGAGYVRRYQTRANRGFGPQGFKFYPDLPLAAGFGVGMTNIDRQIPGEVILLGAAAPIGGKYGRSVRNFFGGVILGELVSKFTGKAVNFPAATKTESLANIYA